MDLLIKTERLRLSPPTRSDAERITKLLAEKEVTWMLGRAPYPYALRDAETWVARVTEDIQQGNEYAFGLYLNGSGLIGSCGLTKAGPYWEIGYWVGKPYWEQGFATEAGIAVLQWARDELSATGFLSGHIADNASSGHVLRKLGFECVGEKMMYVRSRDCQVLAKRFVLNAPPEASLAVELH